MSNQAPEPVAWMRDDGEGSIATTTDVITKRVRDIWLKANPRQIERYTIELYLATPDAAQIRAERDTKAVRALADNWDHDEREFMRELVDALRLCAEEIDALRGQNQDWSMLEASQASLREHMQEIHTLRELVREAMPYIRTLRSGGMAGWNERAEKALEGK